MRDHLIQASRGHRSDRSEDFEKQLAKRGSRPCFLEVADDGLAHDGHHRIDLTAPLLRTTHRQAVVLPVDVFAPQTGDLASPQPIDSEQKENRAVPHIGRVVGSRALDQPADVIPRGAERQPVLTIDARAVQSISEAGGAPASPLGVADEGPEGVGWILIVTRESPFACKCWR
jgi:hypothetical protein